LTSAALVPTADYAQLAAPRRIYTETVRLPQLALAPGRVNERTERHARNKHAAGTTKAYAQDLKAFRAWCEARGACPLPASSETVAEHISECAGHLKAASIGRRVAAIVSAHKDARLPNPMSDFARDVLKGVRRELGVKKTPKAAMVIEHLRAVVEPLGESRIDVRDRALLVLAYCGAFRRGELVALRISDLNFTTDKDGEQWVLVTLRRSKTDQEGAGKVKEIPAGKFRATCPVRSLRAWIALLEDQSPEAPVFVTLTRSAESHQLDGEDVAAIVQKRAKAAKLDPALSFAGHSMRRGFVSTAYRNGASRNLIAEMTFHRDLSTLDGYIDFVGGENPGRYCGA
jgi:site-specific recombinase XerD